LVANQPVESLSLSPVETATVMNAMIETTSRHFADLCREVDRLRAILDLYDDPAAS
jgi:hypothetical protein